MRIPPPFGAVLVFTFLCGALVAQRGDRKNDPQTMLPDTVQVPPAPALSPQDELATFEIADGYRVELVASEPLIQDPVVATFDAAGNLWVCEWRSYMRDIVATNENSPESRVVVLHDRDGDGVMDDSTDFLTGQVLPRAVLPMRGGALVIEPPSLYWCPDSDGDLVADGKEKICDGFQAGIDNPEHSGNGLLWGLDHRIHLANDKRLLRWTGEAGKFAIENGSGGGQWGIAHDDRGRVYFNFNSDWLRANLIPSRFAGVMGATLPGHNHRVVQDQSTFPIRMTPGINRGYQKHMLREDYTLKRNTAVCSPLVYRGDVLSCDGDVFVCEPAGNLVRQFDVTDDHGMLVGENACGEREFLASTDERFRPVHLFGGQDGGLYLVDMYRGVIQHRNYVTSFLRDQVEKRGLEQPIGRGRIWRVLPTDHERTVQPPVRAADAAGLVAALASDCGITRDLARQEAVQRQDQALAAPLRAGLQNHDRPATRIALLSVLQGLGQLTKDDVLRGLRDPDAGVVCTALQFAPEHLIAGAGFVWLLVEANCMAAEGDVAWHTAIALGEVLQRRSARKLHDRALAGLAQLIGTEDAMLRRLVAACARRHEIALATLVAARGPFDPGVMRGRLMTKPMTAAALTELARQAVKTRDRAVQTALFELISEHDDPAEQVALLRGAVGALPKKARQRAGWLKFAATPPALLAVVRAGNARTQKLANELLGAVALETPGGAGAAGATLSAADRKLVTAGQQVFSAVCAACHQLDGNGMQGLAPPLKDSEWATGDARTLIRIALHGVRGPIEVGDQEWNLEMAGQAHLSDQDLGAALSYIRRAFGHEYSLIRPADVKREREAQKARNVPWTAAELLDGQ